MEDVEAAVLAAQAAGLACLGGQPQFQLPGATCEPYWLSYESTPRSKGEAWTDYVERSARDVLAAFRQVCQTMDFRGEASIWQSLCAKMDYEGWDPLESLRFILYFEAEPGTG